MASASAPIIVLTFNILLMKLTKYLFGLFVLSLLFTACTNDDIAENDDLFIEQELFGDGGDKNKPPTGG
jgi:hypothetical protein